MLERQVRELLDREVGRTTARCTRGLSLVAEIAFNDVQESPQSPGGLTLRFARIKGYRPGKQTETTDTIEVVRKIYAEGMS